MTSGQAHPSLHPTLTPRTRRTGTHPSRCSPCSSKAQLLTLGPGIPHPRHPPTPPPPRWPRRLNQRQARALWLPSVVVDDDKGACGSAIQPEATTSERPHHSRTGKRSFQDDF